MRLAVAWSATARSRGVGFRVLARTAHAIVGPLNERHCDKAVAPVVLTAAGPSTVAALAGLEVQPELYPRTHCEQIGCPVGRIVNMRHRFYALSGVFLLALSIALPESSRGWTDATTQAVATRSKFEIRGVTGQAMHIHGGPPAQLGHASFVFVNGLYRRSCLLRVLRSLRVYFLVDGEKLAVIDEVNITREEPLHRRG